MPPGALEDSHNRTTLNTSITKTVNKPVDQGYYLPAPAWHCSDQYVVHNAGQSSSEQTPCVNADGVAGELQRRSSRMFEMGDQRRRLLNLHARHRKTLPDFHCGREGITCWGSRANPPRTPFIDSGGYRLSNRRSPGCTSIVCCRQPARTLRLPVTNSGVPQP